MSHLRYFQIDDPIDALFAFVRANARPSVLNGYRAVARWNSLHPDQPALALLTEDEWMLLVRRYRWRCAYCRVRPRCGWGVPGLSMEHMIPLRRGGDHTMENVVPSCQPCNTRKSRFTPMEWAAISAGLWKRTGRGPAGAYQPMTATLVV